MGKCKLEMKSIVKGFSGVKALDDVAFNLETGEVHALLGINGAGKSTLIKILAGIYQKDEGSIHVDGEEIEISSAADSLKHGITTVYQDPQLIPSFKVYENIFLGAENNTKLMLSSISRKEMREKTKKLLEQFPVDIDINKTVSQMSMIEKESISILRALSHDMSILILDEPTSILTESEKRVLFDTIKILKEKNVSIIFITHRLEEVGQIADRATIFRNGKNVATLEKGDLTNIEKIVELMIGKKSESIYPEKSKVTGTELFNVSNLGYKDWFRDISFSVKKGQILGIFGLVGSGLDELAKVLYGAYAKTSGETTINNTVVNIKSPQDAIKKGIFLVPGDRRKEGLVSDEPIYANITLANLKKVSSPVFLVRRGKENQEARFLIDKLQIAATSAGQKAGALSGGNQQKVVISKGLFSGADVYVFSEPTVGVDVGAKMSIYTLMRELSRESAVIVLSSDCEEVYGIADRVMVLYKGSVMLDADVSQISLNDVLISGVTNKVQKVEKGAGN